MFRSFHRHKVTGEVMIQGTQVPVDFVFDMMREGYSFEAIANALIQDNKAEALEAVNAVLLFPEAVLGSKN